MFQFGVGRLFVNPTGGNLLANPSPYSILTVQNVSVDISQELKELVGQNKIADDIAPGQMKVSGKFEYGAIQASVWNQIFFADTQLSTMKVIQADEAQTTPGTSPVTTVTVTHAASFLTDLGVRYAGTATGTSISTGTPLTRVASNPGVGQYSVTAGTYTFNDIEINTPVLISYVWQAGGNTGYTVQFNNQLMGYGPVFELWLSEPYQSVNGLPNGLHLYACRLSKLNNDLKNTDYLKPSMDFMAFANAAGNIGEFFQIKP